MSYASLPELTLIDENGQNFSYRLKGPGEFQRPPYSAAPAPSRKSWRMFAMR